VNTRAASLPRLWFGIFGAPAGWAVQLIVDYAIVAHACYPARVPLADPVIGAARGISFGVACVCLAVAVLALWTASRSVLAATHSASEGASAGRVRFMATAGLIVSVLFTFAIVMAALPLITRSACG